MGKLGYKPWELHRITFREVVLAIDGFYEQNKYHHDLLQLSTRLICLSGYNAKVAIKEANRAWPIERKGKAKISERALEQLRKLREVEATKSAKEKLDARGPKINS